jgi:hypothetical protein
MIHHTASNPGSDGQADVDYICRGSSDKPLANLYLDRAGTWWICAAGATNTNGKGGPLDNVPADSMNTYAIGVEAANNGTGEVWPTGQQDSYVRGVQALCDRYGVPAAHVREHAEWAPTRKIDPAGPSRWAESGTWPGDAFRADVAGGTAPPPLMGDDEMVDYLELMGNATQYSLFIRSGCLAVNITNAERDADKRTRNPAPATVRTQDAAVLKSLILLGDAPVWYDGSLWPPVSAFGGHLP